MILGFFQSMIWNTYLSSCILYVICSTVKLFSHILSYTHAVVVCNIEFLFLIHCKIPYCLCSISLFNVENKTRLKTTVLGSNLDVCLCNMYIIIRDIVYNLWMVYYWRKDGRRLYQSINRLRFIGKSLLPSNNYFNCTVFL